MKKYRAIFFDWDGTAVMSRRAPADRAVKAMAPLLDQGIPLVIVSGTTIENIAGGEIAKYFTPEQLNHLYLGLARGAYNYRFTAGEPEIFADMMPDTDTLLKIHQTCFDLHLILKRDYNFDTDIVFTRPNYCKIDLMVGYDRGESLFMQGSELDALRRSLQEHGIAGGTQELIDLSVKLAADYGIKTATTCDAKYLEVGLSSKTDNTNAIYRHLVRKYGITAAQCSFWGDEFVGLEPGVFGSDSFMRTELTGAGDFFDVSETAGERPEGVIVLGGGVETFLEFLRCQA
ncbi:HAD family hydrolase [Arcanobacterium hippocoleae]